MPNKVFVHNGVTGDYTNPLLKITETWNVTTVLNQEEDLEKSVL